MIEGLGDSDRAYNDRIVGKRQNKKMLNFVSHKKHFVQQKPSG
jgi:hypothetical protein